MYAQRTALQIGKEEGQRLYKKIFIIFPEKSIINAMAKDTSSDIAIISNDDIKSKIYTIRGMQVMLDRDLAGLYGVETRVLNQAVKRNIERFPERFCFQLNQKYIDSSKSQIVILDKKKWERKQY